MYIIQDYLNNYENLMIDASGLGSLQPYEIVNMVSHLVGLTLGGYVDPKAEIIIYLQLQRPNQALVTKLQIPSVTPYNFLIAPDILSWIPGGLYRGF